MEREASYKDPPLIQVKNYGGFDEGDGTTGDKMNSEYTLKVEPVGFVEGCMRER